MLAGLSFGAQEGKVCLPPVSQPEAGTFEVAKSGVRREVNAAA